MLGHFYKNVLLFMIAVYFKQHVSQKLVSERKQETKSNQQPKQYIGLGLLLLLLIAIWEISQDREHKLKEGLDKINREYYQDFCEQYVLKARRSDWYPCLSCKGTMMIFLNTGETWKYGITGENGELGRYPNHLYYNKNNIKLDVVNLEYIVQFKGTRPECLKEELRKIIRYPELPECQMRPFYLERPPGNPQDR